MIKTYSFTTDEDDTIPFADSNHIFKHKTNNLLTVSPPSVNRDGSLSESGSTIKKRKSRRETNEEHSKDIRRASKDKHRSSSKLDWSKILIFLVILFLLYFAWFKREKWIPRLFTTRSRTRSPIIKTEEPISNEITDSSKDSPLISSFQDKIQEENNNPTDNDKLIPDSLISPSKSTNHQKTHLRIRRTKISFNKDRKKQKHDEQDLSNSSSKIPHHQNVTSIENIQNVMHLNTSLILYNYNDIIKQIRKHLKTQSRDRQFFLKLSKTTGLSKQKLHRFIYHKDYKLLTLHTFISLLDTLKLMIVIVPQ